MSKALGQQPLLQWAPAPRAGPLKHGLRRRGPKAGDKGQLCLLQWGPQTHRTAQGVQGLQAARGRCSQLPRRSGA